MKTIGILLATVLLMSKGGPGNTSAQTVSETVLHSFTGRPGDGAVPYAALVQGSDGNFFGTTSLGGTSTNPNCIAGCGTVFRIGPSGTYTSLYSFAGAANGTDPTSDGQNPGGLVQGSDGNFYGASEGGIYDKGTVFRISPSGTYASLYSFGGYSGDGVDPNGGLVQGSDGNFYGTTEEGGTDVWGTVFRISPDGSETIVYSFAGYPGDGKLPNARLVQGSDGNFYGTTEFGGTSTNCDSGCGTVFRISPSGSETVLYSFAGYPTDGFDAVGGLVQGSDSNFYGVTDQGGTSTNCGSPGCGTVFRISPSGTYTSLYSFHGSTYIGGNGDGASPQAGLVEGSDGNFYGTTANGGELGLGNVFRISPSGTLTSLYSIPVTNFGAAVGVDGLDLQGLVQGIDGDFYGTTAGGGMSTNCEAAGGCGTVFKLAIGSGPGGGGSTNCTYSINSPNALFAAVGGSESVSVIASNSCVWTAASNDGFITITSGSSGSGNGTVHYIVAANTSTNEQVGTMTIAGQTFTVTESGTTSSGGCTFSIGTKTSITLTAKGGSKSVSVKTKDTDKGTDCSWTAVSNNPFITITSGSSGTGNGKVDYTVPGNTNTTALIGTMTIAGETFTVNQDAGGCTYRLSPKDKKFNVEGGSATVKVTPNLSDCDWTAVSNDSFITVTDGASGTGKGTVAYSVPTNATSNVLTGSIAVAGETFTIVQAGVKQDR
jgi:uncharacterized repeat protein (TIGR03803 family)